MLSRRANLADLEGRDLEAVAASWLAPETSAKLDRGHTRLPGGWNQFEVNRRLYNVQDTFDENLYTKRLDKSSLTREQQDRADRIAHQIEKSTTTNIHLQEERGQLGDSLEIDEEDMYSGVMRPSDSCMAGSTAGGEKQGFGRGSGSPGGAWRRVESPPGPTPTSGRTGRKGTGGRVGCDVSGAQDVGAGGEGEGSLPLVSSPSLPPGLHTDSGAHTPTITSSTAATTTEVEGGGKGGGGVEGTDSNVAPVLPTPTLSCGDKHTSTTGSVPSTTPTVSVSKFSLNAAATAFVPSFAVKSPPSTAAPPTTAPIASGDHSHTSSGGGAGGPGGGGGGRGGVGDRGKNRGGHMDMGGRGGHYGGGNYHTSQFDPFGGGGGYTMMPGPMGYGMGHGGYPPIPFGPPMHDGVSGFYPPPQPGYFMPPPVPHIPFDVGGYGGGGMMPGREAGHMGYDGTGGGYYGMQQRYALQAGEERIGGGGVPVAAGLGNISLPGSNIPPGEPREGSDVNGAK